MLDWVNSKTEKLEPVASLVSIHHLRARSGLNGPVSVHVYLNHHVYLHMVLQCVGSLKPSLSLNQLQEILQQLSCIANNY